MVPLPDRRPAHRADQQHIAEVLAQAIDLRLDLRRSLHPLAEVVSMLRHLREAERLAKILDDEHRLGWVSVYLGHHHRIAGDSAEALRFAQAASRIAESVDDASLRVAASYYVCDGLPRNGRLSQG